MSEKKFTPGPWRINSRVSGVVEDKNGRCVASCNGYTTSADNGEHVVENAANAKLIAASPDMYAALERLEESVEYWSEYFVPLGIVYDIKSALKKARGK